MPGLPMQRPLPCCSAAQAPHPMHRLADGLGESPEQETCLYKTKLQLPSPDPSFRIFKGGTSPELDILEVPNKCPP